MKKRSIILSIIFLIAVVTVAGCTSENPDKSNPNTITVFKTPMCGCCSGYVTELEKSGFDVKVVEKSDLSSIKKEHNIPLEMQSCHTTVIGDYFVEGHVPIEAVNKLLAENPDIDGIALPGMLAGSPGMLGEKTQPFVVYSISDGVSTEFMTI